MKNHVYSPFLYLNKNTYKPIDIVGKWEYPIFASQILTYYAQKWRMRVMTGMTVYLRLECGHTHM